MTNPKETHPNSLKRAWAEGRTTFGIWSVIPGLFGAEVLASALPDYVCVDEQHGLLDYSSMVPMLAAIEAGGSTPLTRVHANDPAHIGKVLDAGARGVIVPLVNDAKEAARSAAACRYPPEGNRSYGPVRASMVMGSAEPEELNREVVCLVMVETREGLENAGEIAATPGVDGIYIGPADLALSLGISRDAAEHAEAVERIRTICQQSGIAAGMHATSGESAKRYAASGFDMVTVGIDATFLSQAVSGHMAVARGGSTEP